MYDTKFFDLIREGAQSSAKAFADHFYGNGPAMESVLDVGCGEGWWGKAISDVTGAEPFFIDNDGYDSPNRVRDGYWFKHDFSSIPFNPFKLGRKFDLAICLEMAEHLPYENSDGLVEWLTECSDQILWSAAIPGQGGYEHINEQWPNFWVHKFNDLGYRAFYIGPLFWNHDEVEPWYKQNLFQFVRRSSTQGIERQNFDTYIHPAFWKTKVTNGR